MPHFDYFIVWPKIDYLRRSLATEFFCELMIWTVSLVFEKYRDDGRVRSHNMTTDTTVRCL